MSEGTAGETTEIKRREVQEFWFSGLTPEEKDCIIQPHFDKANPSQDDKRQTAKEYDEW